jgi:Staphylococcal protein of unknown function (DUF960).
MYHKIWKSYQVDDLKNEIIKENRSRVDNVLTDIVLPEVIGQIEMLDIYYGKDRDPDSVGGWVALFLEPITEENVVYKELLGKYNIPSSDHAEVNEYIVENTDIRYKMQLFVMTDYHLIIIYPCFKENKMCMIPKCFEVVPPKRYMTSDIQQKLPLELVSFLWDCINQAGTTVSLDYLQVFKLRVEKNDVSGKLLQYIMHTQEVPPFSKEYMIDVIGEGINDTIYVIDNIEYQTMLFSSNY